MLEVGVYDVMDDMNDEIILPLSNVLKCNTVSKGTRNNSSYGKSPVDSLLTPTYLPNRRFIDDL